MGSRVQSIIGCFPDLCFLQFFVALVLVGLRKQFINNFVFRTWSCADGFNNNNNNVWLRADWYLLVNCIRGVWVCFGLAGDCVWFWFDWRLCLFFPR